MRALVGLSAMLVFFRFFRPNGASSSPSLAPKPSPGFQWRRIRAEWRQRQLGLFDQPEQLLFGLGDAENSDGGRFAGVGVLAGRLADRGDIAFNVEDIVGDLECLADNSAEPVERHALMLVGPAHNR